jgi:hypothetical protein
MRLRYPDRARSRSRFLHFFADHDQRPRTITSTSTIEEVGVTLSGEATREAPVRAEPHPTSATIRLGQENSLQTSEGRSLSLRVSDLSSDAERQAQSINPSERYCCAKKKY